jgi:D-alanyl-D-alanine dipeptidase
MRWALLLLLAGTARADAPDDLVEVKLGVLDLRYATKDNFTGEVMYPVARCRLRRAVAERLAKAEAALEAKGRRLLVWDCYRPTSVQEKFWKKVHDERYVADPKKGSRHSRGAAVDVGLVDKDGKAVSLPTKFDDFSEAAHRDRALKNPEAKLLDRVMTDAGFVGMPTEWWHFDAPGEYPLSDEPL